MAILERYWWLRLVGALLAVATALLFTLLYIVSVLPGDLQGGVPAITDALLAFDIVGVLLGVALHAAVKAALARRRAVRLRTAIDGYQDALLVAQVTMGQGGPPEDLDHVVASWPHPRWAVVLEIVSFLLLVGATFFFGAWLAFIIFLLLHSPPPTWLIAFIRWSQPSSPRRGTAPTFHVPFATAVLSGILLWGAGALTFLPMLPGMLAAIILQPSRMEADGEGITWQSVWGMHRRIRWHEARLLEVASYSTRQSQYGPMRTYRLWTLYGRELSIRWQQPADTVGSLTDPFAQLTRSVIARTGLKAHTLDRELLAPGETLPATFLDWMSARLTPRLGIAAFAIAILATGLVQPILLVGEGIIFGTGIALSLIGKWFKRWSRRRSQGTSAARLPNASAHLTFSADAVYEAPVGSPAQFRLNQAVFATIGAGAALFGAGMLGLEIAQYALHIPNLHLYPLPPALVLVLMGFIIGGLATTIIALRAKDTIMLADARGIRKRWLLGNTFIPWDRVERIELRYVLGRPGFYRVLAGTDATSITWTIHPYRPSRTPQVPGAVPIMPEHMAALVAERTGKPIQRA